MVDFVAVVELFSLIWYNNNNNNNKKTNKQTNKQTNEQGRAIILFFLYIFLGGVYIYISILRVYIFLRGAYIYISISCIIVCVFEPLGVGGVDQRDDDDDTIRSIPAEKNGRMG